MSSHSLNKEYSGKRIFFVCTVQLLLFVCCITVFATWSTTAATGTSTGPRRGHHHPKEDGTISKKNIILFLTDDQDVLLGGMDYMPFLKRHLQEQGATFDYGFVHSPVCCPSRSSILSGLYLHNGGAINNTAAGNCYGQRWREDIEPVRSLAVYAQQAGYVTSYAGKYLNEYGFGTDPQVPPGWDYWFGLVGNSIYYNYKVVESDDNGQSIHVTSHQHDYATDYLPDLLANRTLNVLQTLVHKQLQQNHHQAQPFLAVLAWPTPHDPFTPAPWATNTRTDLKAPRTPNFNASEQYMAHKHWLLRQLGPIDNAQEAWIDETYHHRIEALFSVDHHIDQIITLLEEQYVDVLNQTYFLFTSDNGWQMGQHRLRFDKRQLYEHDIRVPFVLRGPGIPTNVTLGKECLVLNVDIAPTFFDIMHGLTEFSRNGDENMDDRIWKSYYDMDGQSILPCFASSGSSKGRPTHQHQQQNQPQQLRSDFLVSYFGEYHEPCELFSCNAMPPLGTVPWDAKNNTYNCVRTANDTENSIYCRFVDDENFGEYYNLTRDPWQLENMYFDLSSQAKWYYNQRLQELQVCQGRSCRSTSLHAATRGTTAES